ncbi:hypothetical protein HWV62_24874 [Athelia sp. TMB]|nr:hypothetical protein HWV62_24874 [Athelia sp. TMB]
MTSIPVAESARLFQPLQVGDMKLSHRVVLAPLTRLRATEEHVPGSYAPLYYSQRADVPGTLVITEGTLVSLEAGSFPGVPYIFTDEQIAGWKTVVDAVHAKGSFIYLQIAAVGRPGGFSKLPPGQELLSAGNIAMTGNDAPRPLNHAEIQGFIENFATAARNAVQKAGFDGVEVHGANGYLIDQFTQSVSNNRTDEYGGSVANRSRFVLEIISAVARAIGESKIGVRFSPWGTTNDMGMAAPERLAQFSYLATNIKRLHPEIAYLHLISPRYDREQTKDEDELKEEHIQELATLRELWGEKPLIIAGGLDRELGLEIAEKNDYSLVAYGRSFIANPDLVHRLKENLPLAKGDRATYYSPGPEGYIDYPVLRGKSDDSVDKSVSPALH